MNDVLVRDREKQRVETENNLLLKRKQIAHEIAANNTELYNDLISSVADEEGFFRKISELGLSSEYKESREKIDYPDYNRHVRWLVAVRLPYLQDLSRFSVEFDHDDVDYVELSPQISYVLGFDNNILHAGDIARYSCDLRGGN
jgi:hypothetical protein